LESQKNSAICHRANWPTAISIDISISFFVDGEQQR
jgi:hypothetical protein